MSAFSVAGDYAPYFEYLINIVGGEEWWRDKILTMLRLLERKYYWHNDIDSNWAAHVESLRVSAMRDGVLPIYILHDEPSILEVLITLAVHVGIDIMYNGSTPVEERIPEYFNDIIEALGFDCNVEAVDDAVDLFLSGERMLADPKANREVTLWEQANYFFSSQFDIENESP